MERIVSTLHRVYDGQKIPIVLFTKNGGQWLDRMADSGCDALGVDWTTDLADARKRVGGRVALQGNLDPSVLYAKPERIREETDLWTSTETPLQPTNRHSQKRSGHLAS